MHPVILEFTISGSTLQLLSYPVLILAAGTLCATAFHLCVTQRKLLSPQDSLTFVAVSGLSIISGSAVFRFFDSLTNSDLSNLDAGYSLFGGMVAGSIASYLLARRLRLDVWAAADCAAPGIAAGIALSKTGCLLHGCCFGQPNPSFPGLIFPPGCPVWSWQVTHSVIGPMEYPVGVWPTQPIEVLAAVLLGLIALHLMAKRSGSGAAFLLVAGGYTATRIVSDHFRAEQYGPYALGAAIIALAAVIGLALVRTRVDSDHRGPLRPPDA